MSKTYTKEELAVELAVINAQTEILKSVAKQRETLVKLQFVQDFGIEMLKAENRTFHAIKDGGLDTDKQGGKKDSPTPIFAARRPDYDPT